MAAERSLDVGAVLARNPEMVCIDDLASTDASGEPRVDALPRLLGAGIAVLATLHMRLCAVRPKPWPPSSADYRRHASSRTRS